MEEGVNEAEHRIENGALSGDRRSFFASASSLAMLGGLAGSYGTLAVMAGRFLYPAGGSPMRWMFLTETGRMKPGDSFKYTAPSGHTIAIACVGKTGKAEDFLALSSVCPHLGCQVYWEAQNNRFFCPCHNGTFDASGRATSGPPAAAGQSLLRYRLKVEGGLLFIEVSVDRAVASAEPSLSGGQDSCPGVRDPEGAC